MTSQRGSIRRAGRARSGLLRQRPQQGESVGARRAPFGIGVTIVEPGGARTNFRYGGAVLANRIAAYDGLPAAGIRRIRTERTTHGIGDPALMATAMIASESAEATDAPTGEGSV